MAVRDKPSGKAIVQGPRRIEPNASSPWQPLQRERLRTQEELEPIAIRVSENGAVMQRLRSAYGSQDRDLAHEASNAITRCAQEIDPTITYSEGTTIALILLKIIADLDCSPGG